MSLKSRTESRAEKCKFYSCKCKDNAWNMMLHEHPKRSGMGYQDKSLSKLWSMLTIKSQGYKETVNKSGLQIETNTIE